MMLPCPFCGGELMHITSWARSFNPPRLYHEYHHTCEIMRGPWSFADDEHDGSRRSDFLAAWNRRANGPGPIDRITPYKAGVSVENDIDEICATNVGVHFEMMNRGAAFMIVGGDAFWLHAKGNKLICNWSEYREGYGAPPIPHEKRETL